MYHGKCRLSAHKRPTSHLIVTCVHVLRSNLNQEEIGILRRINPPSQEAEDDSDNPEENEDHDDVLPITSESTPLYDLEYLNNSKDAMDIKLKKYFDNMPKHAILANILDPRVKLLFATLLDTQNSTKVNITSKKSSTSSFKKSNELLFKETITDIYNLFYLIEEEDDDIGVTPTTSLTTSSIFQSKRQLSVFEAMFLSSEDEQYSSSPPANTKVTVLFFNITVLLNMKMIITCHVIH